jgi:uncharacterized HAD superfamily protein
MRIGIDFDDTVAASIEAIIKLHNRDFDTNYKREDATVWHLEDLWGIDKDVFQARLDEFFSAKNVEYLDPVAGAIPAIDALKAAGHELYIITARHDDYVEATELWLKLHFSDTFKGIHYGHSRSEDPAKKRLKSAICKELGIELLIDDHMNNAIDCSAQGINFFLLDQPWNQGELPPGVTRVFSWDEIVKKIESL